MVSRFVPAAAAAAATGFALCKSPAFAEKSGKSPDFSSFFWPSSSSSSQDAATHAPSNPTPTQPPPPPPNPPKEPKVRNDNPRTTAAGFDPEALERGAEALRTINKSPHVKEVFKMMNKQEETRQAEENARRAEAQALQAQYEIEKNKVIYEEQKKLAQTQAQTKAQLQRYEDELARKRMQADHEAQRQRNAEMVKMQEESSIRQEQARRLTEEHIQAQRRQTELQKAEIERETLRVKALADAEGRAHEARLAEDVNTRMLLEKANMEKEKWLASINTTFGHIGDGLKALLTDQNKLAAAVGGVTLLFAGVYTTREGAKVIWGYVDRLLGQPALIRESTRGKYPWSRWLSSQTLRNMLSKTDGKDEMKKGSGFGEIILHPTLHRKVRQLAAGTVNTKEHGAPFRHMLFCGPPGTGKTLAAKELAKKSGLDYALMTGGDVGPLGPHAVTKIHELFDWAGKSRKGLLLFIDEADAFLCERNNKHMSEDHRSALNAFLYRTGDQSRDVVLVLATNRKDDLDAAVIDRVDEILEFPLPGEEEREKLIKLYLEKYIIHAADSLKGWNVYLKGRQDNIEVKGITDDIIKEAARKTEGFSGREIAKLMASVQGEVYASTTSILNADLFREVVDYKVAEHQLRRRRPSQTNDLAYQQKQKDVAEDQTELKNNSENLTDQQYQDLRACSVA